MPHLHLDEHGNRDMSPSVSPNLPGLRLAAVRVPRSVVTDLSVGFVLPPVVPDLELLEEREIERLVAVLTQNTAAGIAVVEQRWQNESGLVEPQFHGGRVELTRSDAVGPLIPNAPTEVWSEWYVVSRVSSK